jgi:hypothetical protein
VSAMISSTSSSSSMSDYKLNKVPGPMGMVSGDMLLVEDSICCRRSWGNQDIFMVSNFKRESIHSCTRSNVLTISSDDHDAKCKEDQGQVGKPL